MVPAHKLLPRMWQQLVCYTASLALLARSQPIPSGRVALDDVAWRPAFPAHRRRVTFDVYRYRLAQQLAQAAVEAQAMQEAGGYAPMGPNGPIMAHRVVRPNRPGPGMAGPHAGMGPGPHIIVAPGGNRILVVSRV